MVYVYVCFKYVSRVGYRIRPLITFVYYQTHNCMQRALPMYWYYDYSYSFFSANWVKVNGTKYQIPCALVVGKSQDGEDDLMFGEVLRILVNLKTVIFEFKRLASKFCHNLHCFSVSSPSIARKYYIKQCDLLDFHCYGLYHCHASRFIVLRSNPYWLKL